MIVFLNGQFVPEDQATVSVFDRSFLYGDGLFETMRVLHGRPFRWPQHIERLKRGAAFLKIALPFSPHALETFAGHLIEVNQMPDALLRLTLSRGVGLRGYSPKGADHPLIVMSLHPAPAIAPQNPPLWRLVTAPFRLPAQEALAQFKTCNKLPQILARAEADAAGADEALLLNTDGFVVEGSTSNLFWVRADSVFTPPLTTGILAGVTREVVAELCRALRLSVSEASLTPLALTQTDGVFLSLSSFGIVPALSLDGHALPQSPTVERLRAAYANLLAHESGGSA